MVASFSIVAGVHSPFLISNVVSMLSGCIDKLLLLPTVRVIVRKHHANTRFCGPELTEMLQLFVDQENEQKIIHLI